MEKSIIEKDIINMNIKNKKPIVIILTGPTASGKTGLSIKLAKKINGEIISADSMQIYKNLDVGTAKVTKEEMQEVCHYGIDICDIEDKFSVADFQDYALCKIEEILSKNKVPIIVGGTGLYISSLIKNMSFTKYDKDEQINLRKDLESILDEKGIDYLYEMLKSKDEDAAKKIHKNNVKRVLRALEICNLSGISKTKQDAKTSKENIKYDYRSFVISIEREKLYDRINKRIDIMIENHLLEEVKFLLNKNLPLDSTAMQAIGYKELFPYIKGEETLNECVEKLKQESRRYAKRQITWFKKTEDIKTLDGSKDTDTLINEILGSI